MNGVCWVCIALCLSLGGPPAAADGASFSFECYDGPGDGGGWWLEAGDNGIGSAPVDELGPALVFFVDEMIEDGGADNTCMAYGCDWRDPGCREGEARMNHMQVTLEAAGHSVQFCPYPQLQVGVDEARCPTRSSGGP